MPDTIASVSVLILATGAACVGLIYWLRRTIQVDHASSNEVTEAQRKLEGLELELGVAEDLSYPPATLNHIQAQVEAARMALDIARINAEHAEKMKVKEPVPHLSPVPGGNPARKTSFSIKKMRDDDEDR